LADKNPAKATKLMFYTNAYTGKMTSVLLRISDY